MSCPTCEHTMQSVGMLDHGGSVYWCPRCGTIRQLLSNKEKELDTEAVLPGMVRTLLSHCGPGIRERARLHGVYEAIELPANRDTLHAPAVEKFLKSVGYETCHGCIELPGLN